MSTENFVKCDSVDDEVECLSCEDKGFTTTPGGLQIPCSDCRTGDMFFYHERNRDLAAMVHVDDYLPDVDPEYSHE